MKTHMILPLGLSVSVALLAAACQKPATETAADATDAAVAAPANATDAGGAVSPPQANGAVNTDANAANPDMAAASNSFTEGEARGHIENAGYADVGPLQKTPEGFWTGPATKDGKPVTVTLDFKGAVTAR